MNPIFEIRNLSKVFSQKEASVYALQDISLQILPGEIFGIIGLSGAGKSTLVRCMNLLEAPTEGDVLFEGQSLPSLTQKELRQKRRSISMIFQSFNLLQQRTALDNICFPLELSGVSKKEARKKALSLLETVGLPDKASAYPSQLSGGQKQRVAIARALASDPKVLLCDEATSALDPTTTTSILNLLRKINAERGITVILITHQMSVIEQICDRVAILDAGKVVECGPVAEIFDNPKTEAGRKLVFPDGGALELPVDIPVVRIAFNGTSVNDSVIADMVLSLALPVSIISADTRNMSGKIFGNMMLGIPGGHAAAEKILQYLRSLPGLTAEEVQK